MNWKETDRMLNRALKRRTAENLHTNEKRSKTARQREAERELNDRYRFQFAHIICCRVRFGLLLYVRAMLKRLSEWNMKNIKVIFEFQNHMDDIRSVCVVRRWIHTVLNSAYFIARAFDSAIRSSLHIHTHTQPLTVYITILLSRSPSFNEQQPGKKNLHIIYNFPHINANLNRRQVTTTASYFIWVSAGLR